MNDELNRVKEMKYITINMQHYLFMIDVCIIIDIGLYSRIVLTRLCFSKLIYIHISIDIDYKGQFMCGFMISCICSLFSLGSHFFLLLHP